MIEVFQLSAVPVATLAEAKRWLRFGESESVHVEDPLIEQLIAAGTREVEGYTFRAIEEATYLQYLPSFGDQLTLKRWPVKVISGVSYYYEGAWITLDSSYYVLESGARPAHLSLARGYSWPSLTRDRYPVKVTFTAGTDDDEVRQQLKQAVLMYVGHFFENRQGQAIPEGFYNYLAPLRVMVSI